MASDDTTFPPDDSPLTGSESLPPASQQETTRRKYDSNAAVDELYRNHAAALREGSLQAEVAFRMYTLYRSMIFRVARRYRLLSPLFDEDDLKQEALEAILQALKTYKHDPSIKMKFSTRLEWSIMNIFQRRIGNKDKFVEIYGPDGALAKVLSYGHFADQKKELEAAGYTHTTKRRFCYLSDILWDQDLEAMLAENSGVAYDYGEPAQHAEETEEKQETEATEEKGGESGEMRDDEEKTQVEEAIAPSAVPLPTNEVDLRMIDGLYRLWARTKGKDPVRETDPVVLKIYNLYRGQGEAMLLPFRNNGTALSAEEVKQSVVGAIVQGLCRHDRDAVTEIPFSVSLRVAMKRRVERLHKEQDARGKGGI